MLGGGLGMSELVVILVIALLIFGPSKIPEIAKGLGKGIRGFRNAASGLDEVDINPEENKKELGNVRKQAQ